jgi:hypothetical protein
MLWSLSSWGWILTEIQRSKFVELNPQQLPRRFSLQVRVHSIVRAWPHDTIVKLLIPIVEVLFCPALTSRRN